MPIRVYLAAPLRAWAGGRGDVELDATVRTVGDALGALFTRYPGARDRVLTEQGDLRPHVNVFVGRESVRFTGGLLTPVADGAEISILPAVSGGAP